MVIKYPGIDAAGVFRVFRGIDAQSACAEVEHETTCHAGIVDEAVIVGGKVREGLQEFILQVHRVVVDHEAVIEADGEVGPVLDGFKADGHGSLLAVVGAVRNGVDSHS